MQPTEVVTLTDSLLQAVRRMGVRGIGTLPVIDPDSRQVLGVLHRAGVLAVYERAVELEAGHQSREHESSVSLPST